MLKESYLEQKAEILREDEFLGSLTFSYSDRFLNQELTSWMLPLLIQAGVLFLLMAF